MGKLDVGWGAPFNSVNRKKAVKRNLSQGNDSLDVMEQVNFIPKEILADIHFCPLRFIIRRNAAADSGYKDIFQ